MKHFSSIDHLNPEAVAAFVDYELTPLAEHRAKVHLVHCLECRKEVEAQRHASSVLRADVAGAVTAPTDLLAKLHKIAQSCPAGPSADDIPCQMPETLLDRIDFVARAFKRVNRGQ
ncbi:Anti-sigma factor [Corynebacterium kutscheri]|uniref:Anti-sigma factor n=1 Tax=Corynebacterium kutscheri TaxID=35755 RepID=A0A0F6R2J8_9CORY|nr:anti-sigma factor [Corynebacterium kutscheri]AKE41703.1 hypothetical protein UL82_07710 [Corynebacterium kutscheri]VEH08979.1 Anti-sigma factor [Corynebacterium kutscheri]VEH10030.1 Anti-sigma factor [Corynebacterium kutscheri]VEH80111.1 Anti-sigma factor [Corynebacterium kutscheri]